MRLAFLSTLSLRRATFRGDHGHISGDISIHALLAESDPCYGRLHQGRDHFYPRSPCGERLYCHCLCTSYSKFLSTLSLRRATHYGWSWYDDFTISIHALLAESDGGTIRRYFVRRRFLSTLSLRRATFRGDHGHIKGDISIHALLAESDTVAGSCRKGVIDFYPRSPCGERRSSFVLHLSNQIISIHALLAESDLPSIATYQGA